MKARWTIITGRLAPCRYNGRCNESGAAQAARCRVLQSPDELQQLQVFNTPDGLRRAAWNMT
jgi:hypothetical protein